MILVELLERVANRLDAAAHAFGQAASDFGRAAAGRGQPPGALDDLISLAHRVSWLNCAPRRTRSSFASDEPIDRALQEPDSLAAVEHEPPADQPLLAPARNRLGRNLEQLAQFLDRQHLLAGRLGRHVGRVRHVLDEQPQVVAGVVDPSASGSANDSGRKSVIR